VQWLTASSHQLFATPPAAQGSDDVYLCVCLPPSLLPITKYVYIPAEITRPLLYGQALELARKNSTEMYKFKRYNDYQTRGLKSFYRGEAGAQ
jgi:hypothetical protein